MKKEGVRSLSSASKDLKDLNSLSLNLSDNIINEEGALLLLGLS